MKFCVTDEHGHPVAFYDDQVHTTIPDEAVKISKTDWQECLDHCGCRRFDADGDLIECVRPSVPMQTNEERVRARLDSDPILSALLDVVAEETGTDREDLEERVASRMEAG